MKKHILFSALLLFISFSITSAQTQTPTPDAENKSLGEPIRIGMPSGNTEKNMIWGGVVNEKALNLPKPEIPAVAKAVGAGGKVEVQVLIDEDGKVISVKAVSGHPLLKKSAEQVAWEATFPPYLLSGQAVKYNGIIIYNFSPIIAWKLVGTVLGDAEFQIEDVKWLNIIKRDLKAEYSRESQTIEQITNSFDVKNSRVHSAQISQIINSLQSKLFAQNEDLWFFELGLAIGRIESSFYETKTLQNNLPTLKRLFDNALENLNETYTETMKSLSIYASKSTFSRNDKIKIMNLINKLS